MTIFKNLKTNVEDTKIKPVTLNNVLKNQRVFEDGFENVGGTDYRNSGI